MSRSADAKVGLWTLNVTPAYDKKEYEKSNGYYASAKNAFLIVTNAKGTSSRTAFAYNVETVGAENVDVVVGNDLQAELSEAIDVLAAEYG